MSLPIGASGVIDRWSTPIDVGPVTLIEEVDALFPENPSLEAITFVIQPAPKVPDIRPQVCLGAERKPQYPSAARAAKRARKR